MKKNKLDLTGAKKHKRSVVERMAEFLRFSEDQPFQKSRSTPPNSNPESEIADQSKDNEWTGTDTLENVSVSRFRKEFDAVNPFKPIDYCPEMSEAFEWSNKKFTVDDIPVLEDFVLLLEGSMGKLFRAAKHRLGFQTQTELVNAFGEAGIRGIKEFPLQRLVSAGSPNDTDWHEAMIVYIQKDILDARSDEVSLGHLDDLRKMTDAERVDAKIRHDQYMMEAAFKVGFLYRDAWWLNKYSDTILREEARANRAKSATTKDNSKRRNQRIQEFWDQIVKVHAENPGFQKMENMVFNLAFKNAIPKGAYGSGKFTEYSASIRSDEPFATEYKKLFRNVP